MALSVGVVVPTWHYWINPMKLQPLWELYYATLIRDQVPGAEVDLIDMRGQGPEAAGALPERDAYFYWINKSADAFEIYSTVETLRTRFPKARHMAGGTHVDHLPDDCTKVFDTIFQGTAEEGILNALRDLRSGEMKSRYLADHLLPFENYNFGRRDFIPLDRVANREHFSQYGGVLGTGVYFSRGCGFKCRFCVYNNPIKFEFRRPEQITEEIEYLKANYGIGGVNLRDEVCIPVTPKAAQGFLEGIGNANVIWRGQTVPFGTEDMVALAAQTGCKELALGLESADSDLVLEIANKPSRSIDNNKKYIELLRKYGIRVKACLILGLPGESRDVVKRTIDFLEEVKPDYVAVSGFDPVPGSTFYREPQKFGIKSIDTDLSRHAHLVYRFGEEEEVGLPFEYEAQTPWGKSFTRSEIIENIKTVQRWIRDRNMSY